MLRSIDIAQATARALGKGAGDGSGETVAYRGDGPRNVALHGRETRAGGSLGVGEVL